MRPWASATLLLLALTGSAVGAGVLSDMARANRRLRLPQSCPPLSEAIPMRCSDGISQRQPHFAETVCEPHCAVGKFPSGGRKCLHGKWEATDLRDLDCIVAPCPPHSVLAPAGKGFKCLCEPGLSGDLAWTDGHHWTGACRGGVCKGRPPVAPNGVQNNCGPGSPVGTTCIFSCKDGYEINDFGEQSRCENGGTWSKLTKSCRKKCWGLPPPTENGSYKYCNTFETSPGTKCQLICNGFLKPSSADVTQCDWSGNWIKGAAECVRPEGTCGPPPTVRHGTLVGENCTTGAPAGSTCTLQCDDTAVKSSAGSESVCVGGSWTPTTYKCKRKLCNGLPPSVLGGVQMHCGQFSASGSACKLVCFPPYKKSETGVETTCLVNGTWTTENLYSCGI